MSRLLTGGTYDYSARDIDSGVTATHRLCSDRSHRLTKDRLPASLINCITLICLALPTLRPSMLEELQDKYKSPVLISSIGRQVSAPFAALAFGTFNIKDVWAANGGGIWLSNNGGESWRNITPPNLMGDDPAVRLTGFDSVGSRYLWFAATEPGLSRASSLDYSSNAGLSWHWTSISGCYACRMSISFTNSTHGFALGSNGTLYQTSTGGKQWAKVTTSLSVFPSFNIDFVTDKVGWRSYGPHLLKTTNAGRTWADQKLISPAGGQVIESLGQPTFFSPMRGIITATLSLVGAVVLKTVDGGRTWKPERLPAVPVNHQATWYTMKPLAAVSASTWTLSSPRGLFLTEDGGRHWQRIICAPTFGKGDPIWGFSMTKTGSGWLDAAATPCGRAATDFCAIPVLLRTNDGGRIWRLVESLPSGAPANKDLSSV